MDIVDRLREPKASLFYTDSAMRSIEVSRPHSIELEAAEEIERLRELVADHEEVHDDHKRLVRELDLAFNGEHGAAPQASLCDIVGQLKSMRREAVANFKR